MQNNDRDQWFTGGMRDENSWEESREMSMDHVKRRQSGS